MHNCLNIAEVVQAIAGNVELERDLLHLGLVCRAFLDPAMSVLWDAMDSIDPLIRTIPKSKRGSSWSEALVSIASFLAASVDWSLVRQL